MRRVHLVDTELIGASVGLALGRCGYVIASGHLSDRTPSHDHDDESDS